MFYGLTTFKLKRTPVQGVGFYFAYLVLVALAGGVVGGVLGAFTPLENFENAFQTGTRYGAGVAAIFVIALGTIILKAKKRFNDLKSIGFVLLSALLILLGGAVLGLIPIAYLTTK